MTLSVPPPSGGWKSHTWHEMTLAIEDGHYNHPFSTPWEDMDRLELYYADPSPHQPRGVDYVRIRNVFLRSTQSYRSSKVLTPTATIACKDLMVQSAQRPAASRKPASLAPQPASLSGLLASQTAKLPSAAESEPEVTGDREVVDDGQSHFGKWWMVLSSAAVVLLAVIVGCTCRVTTESLSAVGVMPAARPKVATSAARD